MVLTVLYSIAGLGIAIVNDFKSIEGDRYLRVLAARERERGDHVADRFESLNCLGMGI